MHGMVGLRKCVRVLLNALDSQHMCVGGWDLVKETLDFKMAIEEFGSVEIKKD